MPAGATFTQLGTYTLTSNTNAFNFASIPSTYTDLWINFKIVPYSAGAAYMNLQVGSSNTIDSGNNYKNQQFYLTSSGGNFDFSSATTVELVGNQFQDKNAFLGSVRINGYTTSAYKTIMTNMFTSDNTARNYFSSWVSTNVLNVISLTSSVSAFGAGSTCSLYGIKAA